MSQESVSDSEEDNAHASEAAPLDEYDDMPDLLEDVEPAPPGPNSQVDNSMSLPRDEVYRLAMLLAQGGVSDAPAVHIMFNREGRSDVAVFLSHCPWSNFPYTEEESVRVSRAYSSSWVTVEPSLLSQIAWFTRETGWSEFIPDQHAVVLAEALFPSLCACYDRELEARVQIDAYTHMIGIGVAVRCSSMASMVSYHTLESRWPSPSEWRHYTDRSLSFDRDAFRYHDDDRVQVVRPVEGYDLIARFITSYQGRTGEMCPMCFEIVSEGQQVVVIPQCAHTFHANDDDCIGNSVLEWFKNERTCPVCRVDVSFAEVKSK